MKQDTPQVKQIRIPNFIFDMEMHIQERKKMINIFSQARPDLCKITEVGSRTPD